MTNCECQMCNAIIDEYYDPENFMCKDCWINAYNDRIKEEGCPINDCGKKPTFKVYSPGYVFDTCIDHLSKWISVDIKSYQKVI